MGLTGSDYAALGFAFWVTLAGILQIVRAVDKITEFRYPHPVKPWEWDMAVGLTLLGCAGLIIAG